MWADFLAWVVLGEVWTLPLWWVVLTYNLLSNQSQTAFSLSSFNEPFQWIRRTRVIPTYADGWKDTRKLQKCQKACGGPELDEVSPSWFQSKFQSFCIKKGVWESRISLCPSWLGFLMAAIVSAATISCLLTQQPSDTSSFVLRLPDESGMSLNCN